MDNKSYFKYSQENSDDMLDFSNPMGVVVINNSNDEDATELMKANHKLIELITTYKTIRNIDSIAKEVKDKIIKDIINILETTKLINYSSFCVYLQVVGYSFSSYLNEKSSLTISEKIELIKTLVNFYIDNRHDMYCFHGYSDQVLQVNSDAASSRRKGKTGIEKMEEILLPLNFKRAKSLIEIENLPLCYILPDKGDIRLFNQILKNREIKFIFRNSRENKNPDMLFKIYDHYFILEHKLTNGSGGSQNAEINEIIQFINYSEIDPKRHYVSCLQGNFFKKLSDNNHEPKASQQYNNVIKNLNNNKGNFFVNGNGFKRLVNDFVDSKNIDNRNMLTALEEYTNEKR